VVVAILVLVVVAIVLRVVIRVISGTTPSYADATTSSTTARSRSKATIIAWDWERCRWPIKRSGKNSRQAVSEHRKRLHPFAGNLSTVTSWSRNRASGHCGHRIQRVQSRVDVAWCPRFCYAVAQFMPLTARRFVFAAGVCGRSALLALTLQQAQKRSIAFNFLYDFTLITNKFLSGSLVLFDQTTTLDVLVIILFDSPVFVPLF